MLKSNNTTLKTKLEVLNSIQLSDDKELEAKGKGKHFISRFIEPGIAEYKDTFGKVLITKETLDKFINTMVGVPIIIKHKDITSENVDKERVGVVSEVWYNPEDGWYYCSGVIWDKQAIDLVKNQGWSVSCTYDFETDNKKGTYHGLDYDMQFTNGEFLHLALVDNPRYERANIVVNSKDEEQTAEETLKPQNSFDTVLNAISEVFIECLGELRARNDTDFENKHKRIPKGNKNGGQFTKGDKNSSKESNTPKPKLRSYANTLTKHKQLGLVDKFPPDFEGKTEEDIANFLGIKGNKPAIFKTPIETVKIYRSNFSHINHEKDKTRILGLGRAIAALKRPNIIIQDKKENYYIKFFQKGKNDKIHMQVIRTNKQGGFYKTNFPISKNRYENMKGQVIYDLSSKRGS